MEEQKTGKGICVRVNILTEGRWVIHPSEAFQGIEEGVVDVMNIHSPSEEDVTSELHEAIKYWSKEADISIEEAKKSSWIEYRYLFSRETHYLPVETFVNHTTIY